MKKLRVEDSFVDLPPLILNISMKRKAIGAVVIAEHRNLQAVLSSYKVTNRQVDDVLFILVSGSVSAGREGVFGADHVQTGGFADIPTREFLSLLSKHPVIKDVPFLYISDHDFQGFQIFLNLKYRSKNMAFLS